MNSRKIFSALALCLLSWSISAAELTARFISTEAAKKESVEESVDYIKNQIPKLSSPSEKRSAYIFLAGLQEQLSYYEDAQKSYAQAAGIAAPDAEGMPKKNNEQIVLDAVRCALSSGDYITADNYLNSAVRNSKSEKVQAYIKLYTQWSALCRAEKVEDLQEPLVMLGAYLKVESMQSLKPVILLTLWYITGDKNYSKEICSKYPSSMEAAIVKGDIQLLPTPFWFFVPKSGEAEAGSGTFAEESSDKAPASETKASEDDTKFSKWQLGLFRTESNAKLLAEEAKGKGFPAYITTEKRASGTTYYIVLVNENAAGNMADQLRNAGYDCYAVE
ncbi:MAG: SPOR domain-containing protein [Treponema sp.]|nr:SPOR domain-containing protein [Treponema sp.]